MKFIDKVKNYYREHGAAGVVWRSVEKLTGIRPGAISYEKWIRQNSRQETELERQRTEEFAYMPLFSIVVPLYRTKEQYLRELIASVQEQTYTNWELCLSDGSGADTPLKEILEEYSRADARIHVVHADAPLGISENTNAAIQEASGDYLAFADHDDLLAPEALYACVRRLNEEKICDVLYSDEDKISVDGKKRFDPQFKPDFNLDLLRSNNYITHFFVVRTSLVKEVGGFRREFDGAQDYDFIFRCVEQANLICHIPEVLYHWRTHKASTADNPASKMYAFEAGKRAIEGNLSRTGVKGIVSHTKDLGFYQVEYPVQGNPLVSVLIPNKDQKDTLKKCLDSVFEKSTYKNYEVIIIENNSVEQETFQYYKELEKRSNVQVVTWKEGFNYSAINNFGAGYASGEYLLFLNNDVEVINPGWMEEMLGNCQREEVGITGAKLYYPDDTIQHAGTIIGIGGIAGHAFLNMPRSRTGYLHKASLQMDLSAVTAACMMMKKSVFDQLGGFEERLSVAFNDVDLCLRTVQAGYLVVYNPRVELYHYESKSRGTEDNEEKIRRFQGEIEFMRNRWIKILKEGDPCYNKNLTLSKWNYSLRA